MTEDTPVFLHALHDAIITAAEVQESANAAEPWGQWMVLQAIDEMGLQEAESRLGFLEVRHLHYVAFTAFRSDRNSHL